MSDFLLHQFTAMDHRSKLAHLIDYGIDLDIRIGTVNGHMALYQLYDFYVEVHCSEKGAISQLHGFNCYHQLDTFLQHIAIAAIIPE